MRKSRFARVIWVFGFVGLLLGPVVASAVEVRFEALDAGLDPLDLRLIPGETARLAVVVDTVPAPGLAAFQFDVTFDPAVVQLVDPNAAFAGVVDAYAPLGGDPLCTVVREEPTCPDPVWILTSTGRAPIGTVDMQPGLITVAYGTSGTEMLPTGVDVIALIDVVPMPNVGASTSLTLGNVILSDDGEPPMGYPVTTVDAMVTVAPIAVPGPGFAVGPALFLTGIAQIVADRRRARRNGRRRGREGRSRVRESLDAGTARAGTIPKSERALGQADQSSPSRTGSR